jgi:murein DD-endopeptidase MepM/ murein hydrolase activator NlpD
MRKVSIRGFGSSAAALVLLVAACGSRPDGPAPMVSGAPVAAPEPERVTVRPGQTLSGIAYTYHVPMPVIAEANHLFPPYRIEVGRTLIIPQADQPTTPPAPVSLAALPPPQSEEIATSKRPDSISRERTTPPPVQNLDAKPVASPPAASATPEPAAATPAPPTTATESGTFLWPVRGRILAGYGSGQDGTHNDGINIAAPRGAAVEAADGGVVAYAGNELRGYGNLILVKHSNGWISAYAHCDLILVKRGEKVARGQTIARVGSTGSVAEPQLHFELRRGNHAVDPREFLAPLPSAGAERSSPPG